MIFFERPSQGTNIFFAKGSASRRSGKNRAAVSSGNGCMRLYVAEAVRMALLTLRGFVDEIYRQHDAGKFETPDQASKKLVQARLAFGAQFLSDL
jgi:hypothetical protein